MKITIEDVLDSILQWRDMAQCLRLGGEADNGEIALKLAIVCR